MSGMMAIFVFIQDQKSQSRTTYYLSHPLIGIPRIDTAMASFVPGTGPHAWRRDNG